MQRLIDEIPPDLRAKQSRSVRHHNLMVLGLMVIVLPSAFFWLPIVHQEFWPGFVGLAATGGVEVIGGIIFIRWRDDRYCYKTGFLCPACGKPLYSPSDRYVRSHLITRGECPHCKTYLARPA